MRMHWGAACALFAVVVSAHASGLTEKEAIRRFLAESPHNRELQASVAATRGETRGWSLWPNPAAGYSREGAGLTEFWQYEQQLPWSGRLGYLRRAGTAAVAAAGADADHARWQIISDLRIAFYRALALQQREQALVANAGRVDEVIRILRAREAEGEGSKYDRIRAERERAEIGAELVTARVATAEARARLAAFLGPKTEAALLTVEGALESTPSLPALDEVVSQAMSARRDYAALVQAQQRYRLQHQAAERQGVPEPLVTAGIKRADTGNTMATGGYFAVTVPLPLFNRGQADAQRFRAEAQRVEARRDALEQGIRSATYAAYTAVELRRRQAADYRRSLESDGLQLEQIAEVAYREGAAGILELLDAHRVTLASTLRLLELQTAAKLAEIELERETGAPVLNQEVLP